MTSLRYPIGKFEKKDSYSAEDLKAAIANIALFPKKLKQEVVNLTQEQLDTVYRKDGWTIRQVVHHCADSHLNSLLRCKLALTENQPTINAYLEDQWAMLPDYKLPVDSSIIILEGVHEKFESLFNALTEDDLAKTYIHPHKDKPVTILETIMLYSWHGDHHLAHIVNLKETKNW